MDQFRGPFCGPKSAKKWSEKGPENKSEKVKNKRSKGDAILLPAVAPEGTPPAAMLLKKLAFGKSMKKGSPGSLRFGPQIGPQNGSKSYGSEFRPVFGPISGSLLGQFWGSSGLQDWPERRPEGPKRAN